MGKESILTPRQQQIKKAFGHWLTAESNNTFGFIAGAEWADEHIKKETLEKICTLAQEWCDDEEHNGMSLYDYLKANLK